MEDFEAALNSLLSDPAAMNQIMDLAGKLGGAPSPSPPSPETAEAGEGPLPPPASPVPDPGQLAQLTRLLGQLRASRQPDDETAALLTALRPFLRRERQRKLDRAVQLAGLSQTASEVYRLWKEGELHF